ncbi:MAG: hypothetical protein JNM45_07420 [Rhizobiales bacterium]|nr:hypothetical protein [Hyphomicrobiales bacterium]
MMKYLLLVLAIAGSAATAIASIAPDMGSMRPANITVVEKNQAFPVLGPLVFEECAVEDCSEE